MDFDPEEFEDFGPEEEEDFDDDVRIIVAGMIFFIYLIDFSYFPWKKFMKVAGQGQNR